MNTGTELVLMGEFAPRDYLLSCLTLEEVSRRPPGAPHNIFQELWHIAAWQNFVLRNVRGQISWDDYEGFPEASALEDEAGWQALVREFLDDSAVAAELMSDADALERQLEDGITVRERLAGLAVQNAYHLGKIVSLRQVLGLWPPPEREATDEAV